MGSLRISFYCIISTRYLLFFLEVCVFFVPLFCLSVDFRLVGLVFKEKAELNVIYIDLLSIPHKGKKRSKRLIA